MLSIFWVPLEVFCRKRFGATIVIVSLDTKMVFKGPALNLPRDGKNWIPATGTILVVRVVDLKKVLCLCSPSFPCSIFQIL